MRVARLAAIVRRPASSRSRRRNIGQVAIARTPPPHEDDDAGRHLREQRFGRLAVVRLTTGQNESERPPGAVTQRVDFRRPAAARAADGLAPLPPLTLRVPFGSHRPHSGAP